MKREIRLLMMGVGVSFAFLQMCDQAHAADRRVRRVLQDLQQVNRAERQFENDMSKLSPSQQSAVLGSNVARSSPDDDGDGLPNAAEHAFGTNVCGHDTHGDGNSDATQREAKGVITAVSADNPLAFRLRDGDWLASDTTVFEHGTSANLTAGACVEANGTLDSATNVVKALSVEFKSTSECRR